MNITAESDERSENVREICESGLYVNFAVSQRYLQRALILMCPARRDVYHFWTRVIQMIRRS